MRKLNSGFLLFILVPMMILTNKVAAANFNVHGKVIVRQDMGDAEELKRVIAEESKKAVDTSYVYKEDNEKNRDLQNIYTGNTERTFDAGSGFDLWIDSQVNEKIDARIGFSGAGKGQTDMVLSDTYISHKIQGVGDFKVAYNKPKFAIDPAIFGEELGIGGTCPERFDTRHWQLLLNGKAEVVDYSLALIDGFGHDTTTSIRPRSSKDYYLDFSTDVWKGFRVGGSYYNDRIGEDREGNTSKYAFYMIYILGDFDMKSQYTAYINKDKFKNFPIGPEITRDIYPYGYWVNLNYRLSERSLGSLNYSAWDKYRELSPQLEFSLGENTNLRLVYFRYYAPDEIRIFDKDILRTELEVSF